MKLRKLVLTFTSTTLAISLTGVVLAEDVMNLPASMCRPQGSGSLAVKDDGSIENQTTSEVTALCPVERKWANGALSTSLSAKVWALDRHATENVCCRAVRRSPTNSNNDFRGPEVCTSGNYITYQTLDVPEIASGGSFSYFYIECTIPPKSAGNESGLSTYRAIQE